MRNSLFRTFTACLFGAASFVAADPQLVLQSIAPEDIDNRISQLQSMKNDSNLSDEERMQLDELWQKASEIQALNDKCASIDLSDVIDPDCENLYQVQLPEFETQFFKVTGEIRLNPNRLSQAMNNKRYAIEQCYDALQIEAFYPARYFELDGTYTPEPLSQGFEVSYNFKLTENESAVAELNNRMKDWYRICHHYILHSDGSGNLAPLFEEKIEQSFKNAERTTGSLYFTVENNYGRQTMTVKTKNGIRGAYFLNRNQLFHYDIQKQDYIFTIRFDEDRISVRLRNGDSWRGKQNFPNDDETKGLMGSFRWHDLSRPFIFGKRHKHSEPSVSTAQPSYTENENTAAVQAYTPEDPPNETNFFVQFMTGVNLGLGGNINNRLKDEYYDVWSKSEEWADSSLMLVSPYITAQFVVEFGRNVALGFGGGIAWLSASVTESENTGYYGESFDEELLRTSVAPVLQAEITFGDPNEFTGGFRDTYVLDSKWPSNFLGGFLELVNLIGLEMGWNHSEDFWDAFYMGFYLKFPPRHFGELLDRKLKK